MSTAPGRAAQHAERAFNIFLKTHGRTIARSAGLATELLVLSEERDITRRAYEEKRPRRNRSQSFADFAQTLAEALVQLSLTGADIGKLGEKDFEAIVNLVGGRNGSPALKARKSGDEDQSEGDREAGPAAIEGSVVSYEPEGLKRAQSADSRPDPTFEDFLQ